MIRRYRGETLLSDKSASLGGYSVAMGPNIWEIRSGRILESDGDSLEPRDWTHSFQFFDKPGGLFVSRLGDVWISNANAMRRRDGPFLPTGFRTDSETQIVPRCEDPFGNIWAARVDRNGRENGLAVLPFGESPKWRDVSAPKDLMEEWTGMCADDIGSVWIATAKVVVRNNPQLADGGMRRISAPEGARITSIARVANRQIIVGFADGSIRELSVHPKREPDWRLVETMQGGSVRAMLHTNDGSL